MAQPLAATDCRVCAAIRACLIGFIAIGVFSFFQNLLLLAAPLYMLQVYDRVLVSRSLESLAFLTIIMVFALGMLSLMEFARARLLGDLAGWIDRRLAAGLFERAIQSRVRGRDYSTEALGDLERLRSFIAGPAMAALFDLPWAILFIAAAFMLHVYIGFLAVGSVLLLAGLAVASEVMTGKQIQTIGVATMVSQQRIGATARNAEVIEAMGMMEAVIERWRAHGGQLQMLQAEVHSQITALSSVTKFVRLLVQSLALGLAALLVVRQEASAGTIIAASIVLGRALGPIEQTIGSWRHIVSVRASLKRLKAFGSEPPYRPAVMPLPMPQGAVSVEGLTYRIPDPSAPPILKGISFQLSPGQSLAIVGPSGAGKSTLARLLVGAMAPMNGIVRLDGADIFTWDRKQVGSFIGYLPQDIELFAGSVAANIGRMAEPQPDAIVAAARLANVHDLILQLPRGYETDIGEGGQHLSGGQRQRIALARALLGPPRFVVLDEPNSNLDGEGEIALAHAINALKAAGSTVIVITHRPALVQHVDLMLLLRDGAIEAFGPRQDVIARLGGQQPSQPQNSPARAAVEAAH